MIRVFKVYSLCWKAIVFIAALFCSLVSISFISEAQEPCPDQKFSEQDRRENEGTLTILRQFSFPNPENVQRVLQYDPTSGLEQETWQMNLRNYLTGNFSTNADVIISDDMTSCEVLLLLKAHLKDENYRAYLIPIVESVRKLGVLTRVDLQENFKSDMLVYDRAFPGAGIFTSFRFLSILHR